MIAEWIITIIALVISIVFFILSFDFPQLPGDPGGGALFPRTLSVITGAAAIFLVVRLIRRPSSDTPGPLESLGTFYGLWRKGTGDEASVTARRMVYVFIFSIAYPWFIVKMGFLLSTGIYVFILMKLFRTKTLSSLVLSCITAFGLYFFFIKVLEAYVPPGEWLEGILE